MSKGEDGDRADAKAYDAKNTNTSSGVTSVSPRYKMDELASENRSLEERQLRSEISLKFKISPEDFFQFMEAERQKGNLTQAADAAWGRLVETAHVPMRSDVTKADFESADITGDAVAAYLSIRRSQAADDLCISPQELAEVQTRWTLRARMRYAKVLQRAMVLLKQRADWTQEQAYEWALREYVEKRTKCDKEGCSSAALRKAAKVAGQLARSGKASNLSALFLVVSNRRAGSR